MEEPVGSDHGCPGVVIPIGFVGYQYFVHDAMPYRVLAGQTS